MTAPPVIRPKTNGACNNERLSVFLVSPAVNVMMMEKIIVVAPTTAVPISTGFAVALNVLPAPSFSSRFSLPFSKSGVNPKSFLTSSAIPGICSMVESSNTDWALSVTGPYESTAIVTGPIPKKPNATKPKAKTAGAIIKLSRPCKLIQNAMDIRAIIEIPSQYALKFPATKPDNILSDAPPSRDEVTTSLTCEECTDVNIFTSSGITAPASVPQVMTDDSFHHRVVSPPSSGIIWLETR